MKDRIAWHICLLDKFGIKIGKRHSVQDVVIIYFGTWKKGKKAKIRLYRISKENNKFFLFFSCSLVNRWFAVKADVMLIRSHQISTRKTVCLTSYHKEIGMRNLGGLFPTRIGLKPDRDLEPACEILNVPGKFWLHTFFIKIAFLVFVIFRKCWTPNNSSFL